MTTLLLVVNTIKLQYYNTICSNDYFVYFTTCSKQNYTTLLQFYLYHYLLVIIYHSNICYL